MLLHPLPLFKLFSVSDLPIQRFKETLKWVNKVANVLQRPLTILVMVLSLANILFNASAMCIPTTLMLPKVPESYLRKDLNVLDQKLFNYRLIRIEA